MGGIENKSERTAHMAKGDLISLASLNQEWSQISQKVAQTGHQVKYVRVSTIPERVSSK